MTTFTQVPKEIEELLEKRAPTTTRRDFLRTSGLFVVSVGAATVTGPLAAAVGAEVGGAQATGPYPDPDFRQLDSWVVIHEDSTATFYVGKTDLGQGTGTAFRQLMSEELDIAFDQTNLVMGSTDLTPDQGGSGGSDAIQTDGWPMRRVSAEARRVLLEMASERFGVPVDQLNVSEAVISLKSDPSMSVTYGELVGARRFNVALTGDRVNDTTGIATVKPVQEHRIVGQSLQRYDVPPKVDGSLKWAVDVKLPGMVHARNVRPPLVGASVVSINEASVRDLPGFLRVVHKGNYVAVVCEREEQAINAARQLEVEWQRPATAPFPSSENLHDYMRGATPTSSDDPDVVGDPETALGNAAQVIEAEYDVPYQGHTAFAPAHALADPSDDCITIYSNDMKSYGMRNGVAEFLGMPRDKVRVVWMEGPQAYGRTAADDAGFEAAYLAKELGRPVRVQWMRDEETAWDTKGPAYAFKMRGGLDAQGGLVALDYDARAADYNHVGYNEAGTILIAQLMGADTRQATPNNGRASRPFRMYAIPNERHASSVVGLPLVWETPLRTGNLRDPDGPQVTFAYESFIDELAVAANADPFDFRMNLLTRSTDEDSGFKRARSIATMRAAAEAYGWDSRPSPKPLASGTILEGRGVAYSYRNQTVVAQIVDVEVNRETGHVWTKRIVCAHDCGLIVNPEALRRTLEGGILHTLSRALHEEVKFDEEKVTSLNWASHPSLRYADTPATIDIVMVNGDPNPNRPDLPPYGAGEAVCKPLLAAVANAIHDATGVRLRRVPLRDEHVLEALESAGVSA